MAPPGNKDTDSEEEESLFVKSAPTTTPPSPDSAHRSSTPPRSTSPNLRAASTVVQSGIVRRIGFAPPSTAGHRTSIKGGIVFKSTFPQTTQTSQARPKLPGDRFPYPSTSNDASTPPNSHLSTVLPSDLASFLRSSRLGAFESPSMPATSEVSRMSLAALGRSRFGMPQSVLLHAGSLAGLRRPVTQPALPTTSSTALARPKNGSSLPMPSSGELLMPSVVKPDSESTPAPPKVRKKGKARNKSKSEQSIKPVFSNELRLPPIGSQAHAIAIGEGKSANTEHSKPGARKPTEQGLIAPEDSDAYVEDSDSNDDQDKNHNFEDPLVEIAAGKTDGILKRKKTTDYEGQKGLDEWVMANSSLVRTFRDTVESFVTSNKIKPKLADKLRAKIAPTFYHIFQEQVFDDLHIEADLLQTYKLADTRFTGILKNVKIHLIRNDPRYGASPDPKTITVDRLKIVSDSTPFFDAYTGIRKKVEAGQELRRNIRKKQLIADNERKTQALQAAATVANQSPLAVLPTGTKRQRKPETTPRKKQRIVSKDVVTASDDEDGAGDGYAGGSGGLTR